MDRIRKTIAIGILGSLALMSTGAAIERPEVSVYSAESRALQLAKDRPTTPAGEPQWTRERGRPGLVFSRVQEVGGQVPAGG